MLRIYADGSIELTRGDTARITVNIANDADGNDYALSSGDILTLTIKKSAKDSEILVQKVLTGSNLFHIEPSDTEGLDFKTYKYDVQLTTESGDVYTVVGPNSIRITEEVTY